MLDPESIIDVLAAAPPGIPEATKSCWGTISASIQSRASPMRRSGAEMVRQCRADGRIDPINGASALAALGDIDGAFDDLKPLLDRANPLRFLGAAGVLFSQPARAMREDDRFLPLMRELGAYQYWLDTETRPDVCDRREEQGFEICAALRAAQPGK